MNLAGVLALIKTMVPVLEPIGEQGVGQLFDLLDAQIGALSSPDLKDILPVLSKAAREIVLIEIRKLK